MTGPHSVVHDPCAHPLVFLKLAAAAAEWPGREDNPPSFATLLRCARTGERGIKLRVARVLGFGLVTAREWVDAFIRDVTLAAAAAAAHALGPS